MKVKITGLFVFTLLVVFCSKLIAQNINIEFEENKFPDRRKACRNAIKEIERGNALINVKASKLQSKGVGRYDEVIVHYMNAYNFNPNNALLNYKIGFCYMKTVEKYKAVPFLEKAYLLDKKVQSDLPYLLAQAYQYNYEFDKALTKYVEYQKSLLSFDKDVIGPKVEKKIQECRNAKELIRVPVNVKINNVGALVNDKYPDYSPIVNGDQTIMFFTARKSNSTGHQIAFDAKYYEDIYITYFKDGVWVKHKNPGKPLNTKVHDAIVGVSKDGKTLLTYKVTPADNGDIYISKLKEDKYTKPKRLNKNINTPFHESSGTLSPDGNTLYFNSDREGGLGGRDIWISNKDAKGDWGKPVNMGPNINTSYNEEGVFMQGDGKTLYFSSQGHNSMGGYDIFKTVYENGKWSQPKNIGHPINTPDDDVFFSITMDGRHGYFSSGRKGGYGDQDIYEIEFFDIKATEAITFKGKVIDCDTKQPVECTIEIKEKATNEIVNTITTTPETGDFYFSLPSNKSYQINITAIDYKPYLENITTGKDIFKIISICKTPKEQPISSKGNVYDAKTKEPVCAAFITVKDYESKAIVDTLRSDCPSGEFKSKAPKGKPYELFVTAPDYLPYKETIPQDKDVNKPVYIDKLPPVENNGFVFDDETKIPVCNADITIKNTQTGTIDDNLKSECPSGKYQSKLPKGKPYIILITAPEYIPYSENIPPDKDVNKNIYIKKMPLPFGNVYDAETKEPVCNADIDIKDAQTSASADKLRSECPSGKYQSKLPTGKPYIINVSAPEYTPYSENIPQDKNVNKNIYIHKLPPPVVENIVPKINPGIVYDADSKEPVCDADVDIVDAASKENVDKIKTECPSGKYQSKLPTGKKYELSVNAKEYVPYIETIPATQNVNKVIYIKKIKTAIAEGKLFDVNTAKSFVLPDILYDLDKFNLKPQYRDSLNGLINTMRAFPNITIELGSHTDIRATDIYNEKLSFNRAKSVVDYLISKGIEADRLIAKGYGEKIPRVLDRNRYVISCNKKYKFDKGTTITEEYINSLLGGKCEQEAAHQLNRRTEFKVLREDYVSNKDKTNKEVNIEVIKK